MKVIYTKGHINTIQPYYFMLNGQRYNAAHFNGRIVFGITDEVEPTVPPTVPPTPTPEPPTPTPEPPTYNTPFYVENITNENETLTIEPSSATAPKFTVWMSRNGVDWASIGNTSTTITYPVYPNDKIYLRASTHGTGCLRTSDMSRHYNRIIGVSKVGGNILSLLYGENFTGEEVSFPDNGNYHIGNYNFVGNFYNLFYNNNTLISANELILPVTAFPIYFTYCGMFKGCTSLISAPDLPATSLYNTSHVYEEMFRYCTSLAAAPELPATTLNVNCYDKMFNGCSSLNYIKCLATDISAELCLDDWVSGVSQTGTFNKKAGVTWPSGIDGIPTGWTVVEV